MARSLHLSFICIPRSTRALDQGGVEPRQAVSPRPGGQGRYRFATASALQLLSGSICSSLEPLTILHRSPCRKHHSRRNLITNFHRLWRICRSFCWSCRNHGTRLIFRNRFQNLGLNLPLLLHIFLKLRKTPLAMSCMPGSWNIHARGTRRTVPGRCKPRLFTSPFTRPPGRGHSPSI